MPFVGSAEGKMAFGRPTVTTPPNIVTSNLQVWLDAGNSSSYTGSGTTWTNLVSSNAPTYNYTLTNFTGATTSNITYNGTTNRAITFDGSDDYAVNNTSLLSFVLSVWKETREYWVYWPGTGGCLTQETGVNTPYGGWHDAQTSLSGTNLVFSVWQGNVSMTAAIVSTSLVANQWNHIVFQYNATSGGPGSYNGTLTAYLNGTQVYNTASIPRTTPQSIGGTGYYLLLCQGDNVTNFGYSSSVNLAASIAIFRWYNTVLTANQVFLNYNAEAARFGFTPIVTANLVFNMDAGNLASYPGSGTTWRDITSGLSFTLTNGPTYSTSNGGYFTFVAASSQYAQSTTSLPSMSNFTIEAWHYFTNVNTGVGAAIVTEVYDASLNSSLNYVIPGIGGAGSTISGNKIACTSFISPNWQPPNVSGYTLPTSNAWYQIVGTYDGSNFKTYVNTTLQVTNAYSGTAPFSGGQGINLMKRWDKNASPGNAFWGGRLAIVRMYSTALTQAQITTNYNANKARFGLA